MGEKQPTFRLGPAPALAQEMEVQLGVDGMEIGLRRQKTTAFLAALCGLVCVTLAAVIGKSIVPAGAIGGAEVMTGLWGSGLGIDLRAALAIKIHVGRKK